MGGAKIPNGIGRRAHVRPEPVTVGGIMGGVFEAIGSMLGPRRPSVRIDGDGVNPGVRRVLGEALVGRDGAPGRQG